MPKKPITTKEIVKVEPLEVQTLTLASERNLTPAIWKMITEIAPVMYRSRLFGVITLEAAATIMLKGFELGLGITASFEFVQVIQGKPSLSPRGAMAILLSSDVIKTIEIKRLMDKDKFTGYECRMVRNNGFEFTGRFTMVDATNAGLVKPDSGWMKYPENMCMWRAIGFAADVVAPDITSGMTTLMKMPEAYGISLSEQGDVIVDATPISVSPAVDMNTLLVRWSAQQVLDANDGKIPTTSDEVDAVIRKLESVVNN